VSRGQCCVEVERMHGGPCANNGVVGTNRECSKMPSPKNPHSLGINQTQGLVKKKPPTTLGEAIDTNLKVMRHTWQCDPANSDPLRAFRD